MLSDTQVAIVNNGWLKLYSYMTFQEKKALNEQLGKHILSLASWEKQACVLRGLNADYDLLYL